MKNLLRQVPKSAGFYPITLLYAVTSAMTVTIAAEIISVVTGMFFLGLVAVIAMLLATWRELRNVRDILANQREELQGIIRKLTEETQSGDTHDG